MTVNFKFQSDSINTEVNQALSDGWIPLNSNLILLIRCCLCTDRVGSLPFKFQSDSINTSTAADCHLSPCSLNSNLILLIPSADTGLRCLCAHL